MSAAHTSRIIEPLLRWVYPPISAEALETAHFYVRKAAHLTEYAILAILLSRALVAGKAPLDGKTAVLVLTGAALYAASDEFHQSFVPSRGASLHDVGIDATGATLGLIIFWWFRRRYKLI